MPIGSSSRCLWFPDDGGRGRSTKSQYIIINTYGLGGKTKGPKRYENISDDLRLALHKITPSLRKENAEIYVVSKAVCLSIVCLSPDYIQHVWRKLWKRAAVYSVMVEHGNIW